MKKNVETMRWRNGKFELLDQTLLPEKVLYRHLKTYRDVSRGIRDMLVRGAPAIGVTAAFGMAVAARAGAGKSPAAFRRHMKTAGEVLASSRPTAVNLFWALARIRNLIEECAGLPPADVAARVEAEALAMRKNLRRSAALCLPQPSAKLSRTLEEALRSWSPRKA